MSEEKRDSNFFVLKKSTVQSVDFLIISWLGIVNVFQEALIYMPTQDKTSSFAII